ncbi:TRAP transporter fused permease subunit [uncultured Mailhella sp.]|uniref:TRAP transporter permease n=1 Tax=uncultured Mailhella sp. TaxID=1981031 RepID=UPI00320B2B1F
MFMANVVEERIVPVLLGVIGVVWFVAQIMFSFFFPINPMTLAPIFLSFAFCIVFLMRPFPGSQRFPILRILDFAVIPACIWMGSLFYFEQERIITRIPYISEILPSDIVACVLMIVLLLEAMRRTIGWNLLGFVLVVIAYGVFGPHFPGVLRFDGFNLEAFTEIMSLTSNGVYGTALSTTASFIFYFIIFGALFAVCGGGQVLIDIGMKVSDPRSGGPAKAAVMSSALMGMISGSAVANVTTTGVMTIPMMKKAGYQPHQAGAIEAVASTGGQIMPPIMGVGAFIMAELLGMSYGEIAICAIIPASAYFISVFMLVGLLAKRNTFERHGAMVSAESLTFKVAPILPRLYLLIPAIILIFMVLSGSSLRLAAVYSTIAVLVINLFNPKRLGPKDLFSAFMDGIRQSASLTIPVSACGIIIGIVVQSGLANKFASLLAVVGNSSLLLALFIAMGCCMILGMAMPTVAAYLISVTLFASALVRLDLPIFIVHMFCFYFGVMAQLTPPVCLASFTAAGIADADSWKTGWTAFTYAIVAFLVPFAFAYEPALLLQGTMMATVTSTVSLLIGCYALAVAISGFHTKPLSMFWRAVVLASAICCIIPGVITDIIGYAVLAAALLINRNKKTPSAPSAPADASSEPSA